MALGYGDDSSPSPERKSTGSEQYFRVDQLDFENWDLQPDDKEATQRPAKQAWDIDLSKLDIKHVIAHGTYGSMYRGVYNGRDVAVKVLDWGDDGVATAAETAALREPFKREVDVWHKLDHPSLTKLIGASIGGISNLKIPSSERKHLLSLRACCAVVEYVEGATLKQFLIRNYRNKLPIKVVIQLALDLARGLSYLHSKKIVHRDVKTENMLVDPNGRLKIADFGHARLEALNPQDMTGETGTLGYMAPEVRDGKPYNRKCDVYSFGICLWEIYCCDMPVLQLPHAIVHQHVRPEIPKCCPKSVARILKKCWEPDPEKRPEMEHVVRLLEAVNTTKGGGMVPPDYFHHGCFRIFKPRGP